jgi:hypothetical protein
LALDPSDETRASALKDSIVIKPKAKAAVEAYEKGDKQAALQLAEETLAVDKMNINGVGWIKAEQLVAKASQMRNAKAPDKEVLAVLDQAVRLDPLVKTNASKMHDELMPKPKAKRAKIPKMKSSFK